MTLYPLSYVLQQHTLPPLSPASWCVDSDCTNVNSFNKEHFSVFLDQILFAQCYLLDTYSNTLGRNPVLCCNLYRRRRKVKCFFSMDTQSWAQHWKASAWGVPGKSLNEVCRVEGITGGVVLVHFAFFFFHIYHTERAITIVSLSVKWSTLGSMIYAHMHCSGFGSVH